MISEDNLCGFLDGTDSFGDFLQLNAILVNVVDMPGTVQGFIYISLKGEYHIVINNNLSPATKQEILIHELKHIFKDFPKLGFVIGLDFQYNEMEVETDIFSKKVVKMLESKVNERRITAVGT